MGKILYKGSVAHSGDPRALRALIEDDGIHPVERLIENDEILRKYSEEALNIIAAYHRDKMKAARDAAQAEADSILAAAKSEANSILSEAKAAAGALSRDAAAAARKAAESETQSVKAAARDEVVREFEAAISALNSAAQDLKARRTEQAEVLESEIVCVIGAIARRILSRELECDPSVLVSAVRASLEYFELNAKILIKISPEHYKSLGSRPDFAGKIEELGLGADRVEIVPDAGIKSGGVIVTDSFVEYDFNFDRIIDDAVAKAQEKLASGDFADADR